MGKYTIYLNSDNSATPFTILYEVNNGYQLLTFTYEQLLEFRGKITEALKQYEEISRLHEGYH